MEKSKLIKTLRKLNKEELASFKTFVDAPYFNKNKKVTALLDLICKDYLFEPISIDDEVILNKIHPARSKDPRKLTDLMYKLTLLLEKFLAIAQYERNKFQQKINLMSLAYEKDFDALIQGFERDLRQIYNENPVRDSNYFFETFMIYSQRDYSFRLSGRISDDDSLQIKSDHLDLFYLALKLKDACEMLNRSRIVSGQYDLKMLNAVIPYLLEHQELYNEHIAIQVYLNMYLMLTDSAHETWFFQLKTIAQNNADLFTQDELRSIYGYIQNYCIRRLNLGDPDFLYHLFDIYKHVYTTGLVFGDNKNIEWDFKNFVSLGLRLKEFEWTLKMINDFKDKLPEPIRQNAYTYNLANYHYETGDYQKATRLLNSVEFTEIYYNLDSKAMLLKIYYKVEEEESFYSLASSFSIYLKRNRLISKDNAEVYHNLLRFTKKAFQLKTKPDFKSKADYQSKIAKLKQTINDTPKIMNINWLREEVNALAG